MRHVLMIACVAVMCCAACTRKGGEQTMKTAIVADMSKRFDKAKCYRPVKNTVDSAFAPIESPSYVKSIQHLSKLADEYNSIQEPLLQYLENALRTGVSNELPESFMQTQERMQALTKEARAVSDNLHKQSQSPEKFIGWRVRHDYNYLSPSGQKVIAYRVFYFDPQMRKIERSYSQEEWEPMSRYVFQNTNRVK